MGNTLQRLCCINRQNPHIQGHGEEKETTVQAKELVELQPGINQSWFIDDMV